MNTKVFLQIDCFQEPLTFRLHSEYRHEFMDITETKFYLANNDLLHVDEVDPVQNAFRQYQTNFVQCFLRQFYRNDSVSHFAFVLYYLYNHGGLYASKRYKFPDLQKFPDNFVAVEEKTNVFTFECFGFERGSPFVFEILYEFCHEKTASLESIFCKKVGLTLAKKQLFQNSTPIVVLEFDGKNRIIFDNGKKVAWKEIPTNEVTPAPEKFYHSNLRIGITFDLPAEYKNLFSNGINQNSLFFAEMLLNCGYQVYLLVRDVHPNMKETLEQIFYDDRFQHIPLKMAMTYELDIVFVFGYLLSSGNIQDLRQQGTKIVAYFCGNEYLMNSEKILYSQHEERTPFQDRLGKYDEIWSIPQMYKMNGAYWEILHQTACHSVPFIWSPRVLYRFQELEKKKFEYLPKGSEKKRFAIFEPNISVMKWALPAVLIAEHFHQQYPDKIDQLLVTNILKDEKNITHFHFDAFKKFIETTQLGKEKKVELSSRFPLWTTLERFEIDAVISHQWGNPLNYLYLDLAWMGYPVVHNAELCADIGYYYPDFDLKAGTHCLENIWKYHDSHYQKYRAFNQSRIERYLPENLKLQNNYESLLKNLFAKEVEEFAERHSLH